MKTHVLFTALASLFLLNACNVTEAESRRAEAQKSANDLSKMDVPEIIHFVDTEAKSMTLLLKTVIDGPTAETAITDIRKIIPRLNEAFNTLADIDPDNLNLSIGHLRKMLTIAKSQTELLEQVSRISQIPEARNVLKTEFDKLKIIGG